MPKPAELSHVHALSQLTPGQQIEHILSGQRFVITANKGSRVTAVDNVVLVVVNDNAHKEWICSSSDQPLNKLRVGDIISKTHSYVITYVEDYVISASRTVEISNPKDYYLLS
jgi:alpha-D-ribose 1-methylphosphonate 5-phosphate C-P lyase